MPFAKVEIGGPDNKIHRIEFSTKASMEAYINDLLAEYVKRTHCGETGGTDHLVCLTCNLGVAHEDEENNEPGIKLLDKAYNTGFQTAIYNIVKGSLDPKQYAEENPETMATIKEGLGDV